MSIPSTSHVQDSFRSSLFEAKATKRIKNTIRLEAIATRVEAIEAISIRFGGRIKKDSTTSSCY